MNTKETTQDKSPKEFASSVIKKKVTQTAGDHTTENQKKFIDKIYNLIKYSEEIKVRNGIILASEGCSKEEVNEIKKTLTLLPQFFNLIFDKKNQKASKPLLICLFPPECKKAIDRKSLMSIGQFYSNSSENGPYSIVHLITGLNNQTAIFNSCSFLIHELAHIEIRSRINFQPNKELPTLANEGLAEFVLTMYSNLGNSFLKNPIEVTKKKININSHLLLRKKIDLGFPLHLPTLFSLMPDGGYIEWLKKLFIDKNNFNEEDIVEWIKSAEYRGNKRSVLRATFQYRISLAIMIIILTEGVSLSKYSSDLVNLYSNLGNKDRFEAFFELLASYGLTKTKIYSSTIKLARLSIKENMEYYGEGNIFEKYMEIIEPLTNGCRYEEAEKIMLESEIEWK